MMNLERQFLQIVALWLMSLIMFSCSSKPESTTAAPAQQILTMSVGPSPQSLDPHQITDSVGFKILSALMEPLLTLDLNRFVIEPGVAERWSVSDDGKVFQFFLRENAKWSNGDAVTSTDFVFAFQRILSPRLGNQFATDFFAIRNAEAFYKGEIRDFSQVGVTAVSENVLQINLAKVDPVFLKRIANVTVAPIHWRSIEQYGDLDDPANPWTDPGKYIGNGPFSLKTWQINKKIEVVRNPHYWDANAIKLDGIVFQMVENEAAEERMYRTGMIDIAMSGRIPVERAEYYRVEKPSEILSQTLYGTYYYLFNTKKPPFTDARVRKALSLCVDRQLIIDSMLKNSEEPAYSLSLNVGGFHPPQMARYNPQLAKTLLAEAGFPDGKGFPEFTLMYNTSDFHRKVAVAIQQMWQQDLNIKVRLENQEWKVFLDTRANLAFDVARSGSFSTIGDPLDLLGMLKSDHGTNDTGWENAKFDDLISRAQQEVKQVKRFELLSAAEQFVVDDVPILPIFYYKLTYLVSPKVKGFDTNMADIPNFKGVYLDTTGSH